MPTAPPSETRVFTAQPRRRRRQAPPKPRPEDAQPKATEPRDERQRPDLSEH